MRYSNNLITVLFLFIFTMSPTFIYSQITCEDILYNGWNNFQWGMSIVELKERLSIDADFDIETFSKNEMDDVEHHYGGFNDAMVKSFSFYGKGIYAGKELSYIFIFEDDMLVSITIMGSIDDALWIEKTKRSIIKKYTLQESEYSKNSYSSNCAKTAKYPNGNWVLDKYGNKERNTMKWAWISEYPSNSHSYFGDVFHISLSVGSMFKNEFSFIIRNEKISAWKTFDLEKY